MGTYRMDNIVKKGDEKAVWIGELGSYNAGHLIGKWVDLPIHDKDEINKILKEIAYEAIQTCGFEIDREDRGSWEKVDLMEHEFYIGDTDNIPFGVCEYTPIHKINNRLLELEDLCEEQLMAFQVYLEEYGDDTEEFDRALEAVRDWQFTVHEDCWSMSDVSISVCEEYGYPESFLKGESFVNWDSLIISAVNNGDIDSEWDDDYQQEVAEILFHKEGSYYNRNKHYWFDHEAYGQELEITGSFIHIVESRPVYYSCYVELHN